MVRERVPGDVRELSSASGCMPATASSAANSVALDDTAVPMPDARTWRRLEALPAVPKGTAFIAAASCSAASPRPPASHCWIHNYHHRGTPGRLAVLRC